MRSKADTHSEEAEKAVRDIILARAEYEVGREIVLRLPVAERNVSDFKTEAVEQERDPYDLANLWTIGRKTELPG
jgi:hypothetical protein